MGERQYLCIDLKSFYASVECVERNFDPMTTNLVVADPSRTEKTICLAVTPALKAHGIPGRVRLFEVVQKVRDINSARRIKAPGQRFERKSYSSIELEANPALEFSYIIAPPRMALYMEYSTRIYNIYLKYIAPEDIHVYSIDEVFVDVTNYLSTYKMTARSLAKKMIQDVFATTGIIAAAGIGTNMYLAKVAMDIMAKRISADEDGVRIAELNEMSYRRELWSHQPLSDFWRVGRGYAKKLEAHYLYTMGDIARCSLTSYGENMLYKLFGVNAELLIDHAWGWEPCAISDVKAYRPEHKSVGTGQVLQCPYDYDKAKLIVREMTELLVLDLVEKKLVTDQIVLTVGYDTENLKNPEIFKRYKGEVKTDYYGRKVPKHAHGTANIGRHTSSAKLIIKSVTELYDRIVDKNLLIRRVNISANHIIQAADIPSKSIEQLDLFTDYNAVIKQREKEEKELKRESCIQETTVYLRRRFGKNAILRGYNLREGATTIERNRQIGGHRA